MILTPLRLFVLRHLYFVEDEKDHRSHSKKSKKSNDDKKHKKVKMTLLSYLIVTSSILSLCYAVTSLRFHITTL